MFHGKLEHSNKILQLKTSLKKENSKRNLLKKRNLIKILLVLIKRRVEELDEIQDIYIISKDKKVSKL